MSKWGVVFTCAVALVWCMGAGWWIWVSPVTPSPPVASAGAAAAESRTFADVSAFGATPLVVPVVLAALALWCAWTVRPRALFATGLTLAAFSFVTGFSIGAAYLPAAAAIVLAGVSSLSRAS